MKALLGIIMGFMMVILVGRKTRKRNYALYGFMAFLALLTAFYMLGYMLIAKKPVP
ncbi:MAG TPA: hypothetical protein VKA08_09620 [Balneolales bacterium]|nr:hypothetical protein [Balneolales bacterium]